MVSLALREALGRAAAPERVLDREIDRIAFASDASVYRMVPRAVVLAHTVEEVGALFRASRAAAIPLTFRAAGTSLSGQAVTDGILVEVARHWRRIDVLDGGKRVRAQPGAIGGQVNAVLRPYRVKIGPDPASIHTCTLGGILSNNSSGMCCGVGQNAYQTLESLTFLLPSGTLIDTADPRADEAFRTKEPALAEGLLELRERILAHPALAARIRAKYRMKNTTGYSLNAFLDFARPVDVFQHLLVGSEGTLAFIAEAVLRTVPDLPVKYTGLLLFQDLHAACAAIVPLGEAGAKALELMDRASMRAVEGQAGVPDVIALLPDGAAALLAEFQCAEEADRAGLESAATEAVGRLRLLEPARFTHDPGEQALLWKVRQGAFPSIGAARPSGTAVIIEDVAFPVDRLADAAVDLSRLFHRHGYPEGVIFGHAKDGNLHFVITPSFHGPTEVDRYASFMGDVVDLVVKRYDGALKAEHGTGRNMAPFVETEWGSDAYAVMKRVKELADPHGLLSPGVVLSSDPLAHVRHLKPMPTVEQEVDTCMECGYCEPKCPSRELSLTPRQRIVVRREMARLRTGGPAPAGMNGTLLPALEASYPWSALDTCATDGLCGVACPVGIDTGRLVKRLRAADHPPSARRLAVMAARHQSWIEAAVRLSLRSGHLLQSLLGGGAMVGLTRTIRSVVPGLPEWSPEMPRPARRTRGHAGTSLSAHEAAAVYFPSCLSRTLGPLPGEPDGLSLVEALTEVARRAGAPVLLPDPLAGICCGVPYSSKGYGEAHAIAANRAVERLFGWSGGGQLPVVVDTSPCTQGLLTCRDDLTPGNRERFDHLRILDVVGFAHDVLLPRLTVRRKLRSVALHPVCSVTKMGLTGKLEAVARACSEKATVPLSAGCCGFAGDRGWLVPELTAAATRAEAAEAATGGYDGYFSSSRTCEVGMTRATGHVYRSFVFLLEGATREGARIGE